MKAKLSFPDRDLMGRRRTPWAVTCRGGCGAGFTYLTGEEYDEQLGNAGSLWCCPHCGETASWSDENYEDFLDEEERKDA